MGNSRPYWKVILSLACSLTATVLFVVLGLKFVRFFMPFVLGWIIACIANPMVCWLEKHVKIAKKFGTAMIIIFVLGTVVGLLYLGISMLVHEVIEFAEDLPNLLVSLEAELARFGEILPDQIETNFSSIISGIELPVVDVAKRVPSFFIGGIVMILSAYFFVSDRDYVVNLVKKYAPSSLVNKFAMAFRTLKVAVGGYFKAQFQIMAVLTTILLIGFLILDIKYMIILAIAIAFLDFLPFFGTAVTLLPWAVYEVIDGNYKIAIGLVILYVITQLTRQMIQPKLVGDRVGLKPLPTLFFLYIGYKMGSVLGMILAVPVGMIIINMYEAGAFDYILDDGRILANGILELRK